MKKHVGTANYVIRTVIAAILVIITYSEAATGALTVIPGSMATAFLETSILGWRTWCGPLHFLLV
jgi:hypothetical protein